MIQIYATELAPHARGLAMSLHSSFFFSDKRLGRSSTASVSPALDLWETTAVAALVLLLVGIACARRLRRKQRRRNGSRQNDGSD